MYDRQRLYGNSIFPQRDRIHAYDYSENVCQAMQMNFNVEYKLEAKIISLFTFEEFCEKEFCPFHLSFHAYTHLGSEKDDSQTREFFRLTSSFLGCPAIPLRRYLESFSRYPGYSIYICTKMAQNLEHIKLIQPKRCDISSGEIAKIDKPDLSLQKIDHLNLEDLEKPNGLGFLMTIRSGEQLYQLNYLLNQIPISTMPIKLSQQNTQRYHFECKDFLPIVSTTDSQTFNKLNQKNLRFLGAIYSPHDNCIFIPLDVIYRKLLEQRPDLNEVIVLQSNLKLSFDQEIDPNDQLNPLIEQFCGKDVLTTNIFTDLFQIDKEKFILFPDKWTLPVTTLTQSKWETYFRERNKSQSSEMHPDQDQLDDFVDRTICIEFKGDKMPKINFSIDIIVPSARLLEVLANISGKMTFFEQGPYKKITLYTETNGRKVEYKTIYYKK